MLLKLNMVVIYLKSYCKPLKFLVGQENGKKKYVLRTM